MVIAFSNCVAVLVRMVEPVGGVVPLVVEIVSLALAAGQCVNVLCAHPGTCQDANDEGYDMLIHSVLYLMLFFYCCFVLYRSL